VTLEGVQAPAETPGLASVVETVDMTAHTYQKTRIAHWDQVARKLTEGRFGIGGFYQKQLAHYYSLLVAPGMKVLEVGCGNR
jgi:cyclopropane fatty-acyl-phospholipid synthase-like methyltransferase